MLWSHQDALYTVAPTRDMTDEVDALRWREAILKVSDILDHGLENRRDLAQVLACSLDHALKQLLIHGDDSELMTLEVWLEAEHGIQTAVKESRAADVHSHSHRIKDLTTWNQIAHIGNEYCLREPLTRFFGLPSIINVGHRA